jgi:arabinofuranosyltransferase
MGNRSKEKNLKYIKEPETVSLNPNWVYMVLGFLIVIFIYFCFSVVHIQDDSFITFRYVKNFLHGNGLVFNPGERVEGYTSILWVFLLSGFAFIGIDIVSAAQILGVIFGAGTIFVTYLLADNILLLNHFSKNEKISSRDIILRKLFTLFPCLLLTFNGALHYWCISGMETGLFIFLTVTCIYLYVVRKKKNIFFYSSLFLMLNSLARPEGVLIFAIVTVHFWFYSYFIDVQKNISNWTKLIFSKRALIFYSIFLFPNLLLLFFRLSYYGYPFPNTFYAKTGFSLIYIQTGLEYTWDFIKTYMLIGVMLLPLIYFIIKKKKQQEITLLILIVSIYCLYIIFIGGDVLPIYRFFLALLPLLFILFSSFSYLLISRDVILSKLQSSKHEIAVVIIFILGITSINYFVPKEKISKFSLSEDRLVIKMTGTANWISNYQISNGKKLTVAASTIGALSYYSDAIIIDMLGLTDATIAHHPSPIQEISKSLTGWKEKNYNADYVLSRKPDFIYFSTGIKPSAFAERALFIKEEFINYYYPRVIQPISNLSDNIYARKIEIDSAKEFVKFSSNPNFNLDYIDLYIQTINMRNDLHKADQLFSNCEKIMDIGPLNFSEPYRLESLIYARLQNIQKSIEYSRKAVTKNKFDMLSHLTLMRYYTHQGIRDSARWHREMLLKYNPEIFSIIKAQ